MIPVYVLWDIPRIIKTPPMKNNVKRHLFHYVSNRKYFIAFINLFVVIVSTAINIFIIRFPELQLKMLFSPIQFLNKTHDLPQKQCHWNRLNDVIVIITNGYLLTDIYTQPQLRISYVITLNKISTIHWKMTRNFQVDLRLKTKHISWKFQSRSSMHFNILTRMFIIHRA